MPNTLFLSNFPSAARANRCLIINATTDDSSVYHPHYIVQKEMDEGSAVSHDFEKPHMDLSSLVFTKFHDIVNLIDELEEIEYLSVLAHRIGYSIAQQLVVPRIPQIPEFL